MRIAPQTTQRLAMWALAASPPGTGPVDTREAARELGEAGYAFGHSGFWDEKPRPLTPEQAAERLERGKSVDVRGNDWPEWHRCDREDLPDLSRYAQRDPGDELATRLRRRTAMEGDFGAFRALAHDQPISLPTGPSWLRVQNLEDLRLLDFLDGQTDTPLARPAVAQSLAELARMHREVTGDPPAEFQARALAAYRGGGVWVGPSIEVSEKLLADPEEVKRFTQPFWQLQQQLRNGYLAEQAFQACRRDGPRPFEDRLRAAGACFGKDRECYDELVHPEGEPRGMDERLALLERLKRELVPGEIGCSLAETFHHVTRKVPGLAPPGREDEWVEHYLTLVAQTRSPRDSFHQLKKMRHDVTRERIDRVSWKTTRWNAPELIFPTRRRSRCGTRDQRRAAAVRLYALIGKARETTDTFKLLFPPGRSRDPVPTAEAYERLSRRLDQLELRTWDTRRQALTFLDTRCQDDLAAGLDRLEQLLARQALTTDKEETLARALGAWDEAPGKSGLEERAGRLIVGGVTVRLSKSPDPPS